MPWSPFAPIEGWLAPAPSPARVAFLKAQPFAHRGLHGIARIENSRAAFRAAIAAGHGIELDVQGSVEGVAMVFHDDRLERLTRATGRVDALGADELARIVLAGTDETIARLDEVLRIVGGRVPVLIEVKRPRHRLAALCLSVRRALEGYVGDVAVMSFDPRVGQWFARQAPRIVRGLVASDADWPEGARGRMLRLAALRAAAPDFLAWDVRELPHPITLRARLRGMPIATWTVRTAAAEAIAAAHADAAIYEHPR